MNKYKIVVSDTSNMIFNAEVEAKNKAQAISIIKEHYAFELGTDEDSIEIIEINKI